MSDEVGGVPKSATGGGTPELLQIEAFDPSEVRPWKFHNRFKSGLDEASIAALAASIKRDGQQQLGLARRLPAAAARRGHAHGGGDLWRPARRGVPARGTALAGRGAGRLVLRRPVRRAHAQRERVDGKRLAA